MKKTYEKPYLAVESFQLNAAVASSCTSGTDLVRNASDSSCMETVTMWGFFGPYCGQQGGTDIVTPGASPQNDMFCYHGPNDLAQVFAVS